jgi:hypothetical protein
MFSVICFIILKIQEEEEQETISYQVQSCALQRKNGQALQEVLDKFLRRKLIINHDCD